MLPNLCRSSPALSRANTIPSIVKRRFSTLVNHHDINSIRSNRFFFTYSKLICQSLAYLSGLCVYDALSYTLSSSSVLYNPLADIVTQKDSTKSANTLTKAWLITLSLILIVSLLVYRVVKLSEKKFSYQLAVENKRIQLLQEKLIKETKLLQQITRANQEEKSFNSFSHLSDRTQRKRELNHSPIIKGDSGDLYDLGGLDNAKKQSLSNLVEELQTAPIAHMSTRDLFVFRLSDLLCYYAIFIAVYSLQNCFSLSLPTQRFSVAAVYFLSLLVLSLIIIHFISLKPRKYVEQLEEEENHCRANNNGYQSFNCSKPLVDSAKQSVQQQVESQMNDRQNKLKVRLSIWRKFNSYITSSLSYLLAYALWGCFQVFATNLAGVDNIYSLQLWLWLIALFILFIGGLFLVLINIRIRSSITAADAHTNKLSDEENGGVGSISPDSEISPAELNEIHWKTVKSCASRLCLWPLAWSKSGEKLSNHKVYMCIDVLEGGVTSEKHQLSMEGLSYIIALAFSAAIGALISATPIDAQTFRDNTTPNPQQLIIYAVSSSLIFTAITYGIELRITQLQQQNQLQTEELMRSGAKKQLLQLIQENEEKSQQPQSSPDALGATADSLFRRVFLHEYELGVGSVTCQGLSLMMAYAWVSVFTYILLPAVLELPLLAPVNDILIRWLWALLIFVIYFAFILASARLFKHDDLLQQT
jgi:hypothetical protein